MRTSCIETVWSRAERFINRLAQFACRKKKHLVKKKEKIYLFKLMNQYCTSNGIQNKIQKFVVFKDGRC